LISIGFDFISVVIGNPVVKGTASPFFSPCCF